MRTHAIVISISIVAVLYAADERASKPTHERARDRIIHIEPGIIREIPPAPRLCDRLNIHKERVSIGDCNLYCEQEGRGTPLVLVSGGPGTTHHGFHPHFSRAAEFAHVIYYDQRGCGLSDYKPGKGYSIGQAVDDLDRLRRGLDIEKWSVLGHSYGGLLAQCYAIEYPENLRAMILVSSSTGLHGSPLSSRERDFISEREREKIDEIRRTPGLSLAQLVYNIHLNGDWKRQNYYRPTREQIAQAAFYGWAHDNGFNGIMSRSLAAVDLTGTFGECPIPTLIVEGKWDMSWDTEKPERFRQNHPNARLVVFGESGHSPFADEPERFFDTLKEFMGDLPAVPAERLAQWKSHLIAREQNKKGPLPEEEAGSQEIEAIEEFRRIKARILAGEGFADTSTPLHAALTKFSQLEPGQTRDYFTGLEILRAPLPPKAPEEGCIWPIFAGSNQLEDTFVVTYSKGQWIWIGNVGASLDWRLHKAAFEEWARQKIQRRSETGDSAPK